MKTVFYPRTFYEGSLHRLLRAIVKEHLEYWRIPYKDMDKPRYAYKRRPDFIAYKVPAINEKASVELAEAWGKVFLNSPVHVFNIECLTKRKYEKMQEVVYKKIKQFSKHDIGIAIVVSSDHSIYFKQISQKVLESCRIARHVQLWSVNVKTRTFANKCIIQINDPVGLKMIKLKKHNNNCVNQRHLLIDENLK